MQKKSKKISIILNLILGLLFGNLAYAQATQSWQILVPIQLQKEEAVKVVLNDLRNLGQQVGIDFKVTDDLEAIKSPAIIVGGSSLNKAAAELENNSVISFQVVDDEQGYEIITNKNENGKVMIISGGSVIGNVYGLYWLWDRMRVYKTIPDINVIRIPALKTRMSLAWGRRPFGGGSKETMQQALRQSINWVSGAPILDLIPWNSEQIGRAHV